MSTSIPRLLSRATRASCSRHPYRCFATVSSYSPPPPSTSPYEVFDDRSKARQRDRAVLRLKDRAISRPEEPPEALDYLREELAERLAERVEVKTSP